MIYIYIDEDGHVGTSTVAPTATDRYAIGDGRLQVLVAKTEASGNLSYTVISEIDEDGSEYEPSRAEIHNEEGDYFHVVG